MVDAPQLPQSLPAQAPSQVRERTNTVEQIGLVIIIFSILGAVLRPSPDKAPYLSTTEAAYIVGGVLGAILVWNVVIGWVISKFREKVKQGHLTYRPFDFSKELPLYEEELLKHYGTAHRITKFIPEPEFGEKAAKFPDFIRVEGVCQDRSTGVCIWVPFSSSLTALYMKSSVQRFISSYERDHKHIETTTHSWSGAKKSSDPIIQTLTPRPTQVRIEVPQSAKTGEEEDDETENTDDTK